LRGGRPAPKIAPPRSRYTNRGPAFAVDCLIELNSLYNQYLTEMSKIAVSHGATIDKYVGDAIMGFFGDRRAAGARRTP
jgi:hypothetical protein